MYVGVVNSALFFRVSRCPFNCSATGSKVVRKPDAEKVFLSGRCARYGGIPIQWYPHLANVPPGIKQVYCFREPYIIFIQMLATSSLSFHNPCKDTLFISELIADLFRANTAHHTRIFRRFTNSPVY